MLRFYSEITSSTIQIDKQEVYFICSQYLYEKYNKYEINNIEIYYRNIYMSNKYKHFCIVVIIITMIHYKRNYWIKEMSLSFLNG